MTDESDDGDDSTDRPTYEDRARDLFDRFNGGSGGPSGPGGPSASGGDDDDGLSNDQEEKIDHIVGEARERAPEALAKAEARRAREAERGIPPSDGAGNLSPATKQTMNVLTGLPPGAGSSAGTDTEEGQP
jgi:hypothetical protein